MFSLCDLCSSFFSRIILIGLAEKEHNSNALAIELSLSCTDTSPCLMAGTRHVWCISNGDLLTIYMSAWTLLTVWCLFCTSISATIMIKCADRCLLWVASDRSIHWEPLILHWGHMSVTAYQISVNSNVWSRACWEQQGKHQSPILRNFMKGSLRWPVIF